MHCDLIESWRKETFKILFLFLASLVEKQPERVETCGKCVWNCIVLGSCACFDCFPGNWRRHIAYRIPLSPSPPTKKNIRSTFIMAITSASNFQPNALFKNAQLYFKHHCLRNTRGRTIYYSFINIIKECLWPFGLAGDGSDT